MCTRRSVSRGDTGRTPLKCEFQVSNESFFSNFKKFQFFSDLTGYAVFLFLFAKPGDPNKEACTKALFSEKPE